jgi:hypothetical protein
MLNAQSSLFELLAHSSDTHAYPTRHTTRGLFTVPKSRTDYGRCTVLNKWNSIPHQVTHTSSKIRFKEQIKKTPYGTAGTVKQHKHRHRHMHIYTHDSMCTIHNSWGSIINTNTKTTRFKLLLLVSA